MDFICIQKDLETMKGCARVKVYCRKSFVGKASLSKCARGDVLLLKDPTKLISADLHFLLDVVTEGIVVPHFARCMV